MGVQAGFRKGGGTRDQIANIFWVIKKAREFQKNIYFCFTDYAKAFDCVDHKNCEKFLKWWEYQTTLQVSWETWMQVKKQQLGDFPGGPVVKNLLCNAGDTVFIPG